MGMIKYYKNIHHKNLNIKLNPRKRSYLDNFLKLISYLLQVMIHREYIQPKSYFAALVRYRQVLLKFVASTCSTNRSRSSTWYQQNTICSDAYYKCLNALQERIKISKNSAVPPSTNQQLQVQHCAAVQYKTIRIDQPTSFIDVAYNYIVTCSIFFNMASSGSRQGNKIK